MWIEMTLIEYPLIHWTVILRVRMWIEIKYRALAQINARSSSSV